jgi:hypothetical protein
MALAIMVFSLVICAVFLGVAGLMLWMQEVTLRNAVPVPAEVVGSAVASREDTDPDSGGRLVYYPAITYRMDLKSGPTTSTQLYPSGYDRLCHTPDEAKKIADQYPVGRKIQAMADPADSRRCYLIARRSPMWWIFCLLGACVATAGVANYLTKGSKYNP